MSSIFVQISSYHDFELPRTIIDCLKKSSGENTITFGVHIVYYENDEIKIPDILNIKYEKHKAPENIGVGVGRYIANSFYSGEDYYLQIDSHMRFREDWDKSFISNYLEYKKEGLNPVISAYPSSYDYENYIVKIYQKNPEVYYTDFIQGLSFHNKYFIPHQRAVSNVENNIFTKSVSAASIFSSGEMASVAPNKKMFFWGEEILTAVRLYTNGFDLLLPKIQNLYHLYTNGDTVVSNLRRSVFSDFPELSTKKDIESKEELDRIFSKNLIGEQEFGSKRSLKQYEIYAEVDFRKKIASPYKLY